MFNNILQHSSILSWIKSTISLSLIVLASACSVEQKSLEELVGYTASADPSLTGLTMSIVGGNFQIAAPGSTFSDPFKVQILNNGSPLTNKTVNFAFTTAVSGALSSITATTDSQGMASVTLTAGASAGTVGVQALYQSASVNFTGTIIDQSGVSIAVLAGNGQSADVNSNYSNPLKVLVTNNISSLPAPNIIVSFVVTGGNSKINGSSNTLNVTTDSLGVASINLQAGTIAGTDSVKAMVAANVTQFVTFNHTASTSPGFFSLTNSTITSSLNAVIANGADTTTLTFTLKDQYGNILSGPIGTVAFSATQGTLIGSPFNVGDGRYTQTWQSPATGAGTAAVISATYNAAAVSNTASINLAAGTHSISNSTITASPIKVTADGTSFSLITVTLKDPLGNQLTSGGETIVISKSGSGNLQSSVNDVGNGTYTQVLLSTSSPGSSNLTATINGTPLGVSTTVNFVAGAANATTSRLSVTQSIIPPNDSTLSLITLSTRDINNNIRDGNSNGGSPTVSFTTNIGTLVGAASDNGDGTFQQYIKSAAPGTATIRAVINGVTTTHSTNIYFNSQNSIPSTQFSTVSYLGGQSYIPADGVSTITLKATIKTSSNTQFTSGGNTVAFQTTAGTLTGPVSDLGNGTYTQTLTAPNASAANVVVSATVDGNTISNTSTINFYGSISLATSTINVTYANIEATGSTSTIIILQAKDSNSIAIPTGGTAGITFHTTAGTLLGSISDNSNGTYTQVLQSAAVSSVATVSAKLSGIDFSATKNVTFFTANNWAGLTVDCTADDMTGTFASAPTSITKRIRLWGNNIVVDSGTLTMNTRSAAGYCPSDFTFGNVAVKNNGFITHTVIGSGTQAYAIEFTADSLTVDGTSSITANSKGLGASGGADNLRIPSGTSASPTFANSTLNKIGTTIAAHITNSYGGEGNSASGTASNTAATYGSLFEPNDPGASGGWSPSVAGGVIKINVTGIATINGSVSANGTNMTTSYCNAGTGGSIWLNVGTLQGAGTINAIGGGTNTGCAYYNPAGGGRIAIYYSNLSGNFAYGTNIIANVKAYGGAINSGTSGGSAGTIYLKSSSQTYGDLLINNNNIVNTSGSTTIRFPTITTPDTVTANTITKTAYFKDIYKSDCSFKNYFVHANTLENATVTRLDDTYFKISSCDADNIQISSGSFTAAPLNANTATNFETFMIFDHIEITGKATVNAPHLISLNGSISDSNKGVIVGSFTNTLGFEFLNASLDWNTAGLHAVGNPVNLDNIPFLDSTKNMSLSNGFFHFSSTLRANELTLSGTNLTARVPKGTQSITLSGALNVTNTSTLTHLAAVNSAGGAEYWLDIAASALTLDSTSSINVSAKGYGNTASSNSCSVVGNQRITTNFAGGSGANMNAGASHGGYGTAIHASNMPYGSVTNPSTAGGVCVYSTSNPLVGGGVARISLGNGTATINGNIQANGASAATSVSYGSAGGSVYLSAGNITGSGSAYISANGGFGSNNAGSGGRIAIHYTALGGRFAYPTDFINNVRAFGATSSGTAVTASPGTVFAREKSNTYGDVIINNNGVVATCWNSSRCGAAITSPARSTISSVTTDSATYASASLFLEHAQNTNAIEGFAVVPNINEVATTTLNDHSYFPITSLSAATISSSTSGVSGVSANGSISAFPFVVENLQLTNGGTLYLNENLIVRKGDIISSDLNSFVANGGTTGTGKLEVPGVSTLNLSQAGASTQSPFSMIMDGLTSITLGTNSNLNLTLPTTINGNVNLTGNGSLISTSNLTINGDLNLNNSSSVQIGTASYSPNLIVSGDITLNDTSVLSPKACTSTTPYRLYATAANINIGPTASINGTGTGTPPGTSAGYVPTGESTMGAFNTILSAAYGSPASYGGLGGTSYLSLSGAMNTLASGAPFGTYGNLYLPNEPGMGSAAWNGNGSSAGGGAIRLNVSNTLTNNGMIVTNGVAGSGTRTSTGAGGGILIQTSTITGTGSISANGGNQSATSDYGTGGGGRIAIYYTTASGNFTTSGANPSILTNVLATGGIAGIDDGTRVGGAGTIYLKSSAQTYGDLVINNNNYTGTYGSTYFDAPISAPNTNITNGGTSVNKTGQFGYGVVWTAENYLLPNKWFNFFVNPKTAQNGTTTLSDDTVFKITASDTNSLTTADVSSVATSGDTFKLQMIFDNLEVRGKGNLYAPRMNIKVISGDLSSGDTSTLNQDGNISAGVMDVSSATWNATANAGGTITNRCGIAGTGITINCP